MSSDRVYATQVVDVVGIDDRTNTEKTCLCTGDRALDRLRDLIALGLEQPEASAIAFGDAQPGYGTSPLARKIWVWLMVRRVANDTRRRLGLPEISLAISLEELTPK